MIDNTGSVWNVRDMGAVGNGVELETAVLQQAINACSAAGGGRVVLPAGRYLTGTLELKSGVTLYLAAGSVLLGSTRIEDYTPQHVIYAEGVHDIGLAGPGTIDGQAAPGLIDESARPQSDWQMQRKRFGWVPHFGYTHSPCASGDLIRLRDCRNVTVLDVTLRGSAFWTLNLLCCNDVRVRGIRIRNPLHAPNTDGIDVCACDNVLISDCDIVTADDAICLKDGIHEIWGKRCSNVVVTNCRLTTVCNAFKIGTATKCDFENITVSNCVFCAAHPDDPMAQGSLGTIDPAHHGNALAPLSGIAIETVDGGHVRGVSLTNIVMQDVRAPLFLRRGNRDEKRSEWGARSGVGLLEDISISHVIARGAAHASSIAGIPGYPVTHVSLSDIRVGCIGKGKAEWAEAELPELEGEYPEAVMWGPLPAYGLFVRHAEDVSMRDVSVRCSNPDPRPFLVCDDVRSLRLTGLQACENAAGSSLLRMKAVRGALLRDPVFPPQWSTWTDGSTVSSSAVRDWLEPAELCRDT